MPGSGHTAKRLGRPILLHCNSRNRICIIIGDEIPREPTQACMMDAWTRAAASRNNDDILQTRIGLTVASWMENIHTIKLDYTVFG